MTNEVIDQRSIAVIQSIVSIGSYYYYYYYYYYLEVLKMQNTQCSIISTSRDSSKRSKRYDV